MPIPREAFEQGLDEVDQKICAFLEQNHDMAYTMEEIAQGLGISIPESISGLLHLLGLGFRMSRLVQMGYLERQETGGGTYFAWRQANGQKSK